MEKQVNVIAKQAEVLVMTNLTEHENHARVYFEPSNRYSEGGGTLTIALPDRNLIGQHFFSHVGQASFKEFIAQSNAPYLIGKLFKGFCSTTVVQDSDELFNWVWREGLHELKEARNSGEVSKNELRKLYEDLEGNSFDSLGHLVDLMSQESFSTMEKIYGGDWYWDRSIHKPNDEYLWIKSIIDPVLKQLKKMVEVV